MHAMDGMTPTVLVVEPDVVERERLADALEEAGYEALLCGGPTGPDYTCIGSREGWCPLIDKADVVVLDLMLQSDLILEGASSEELLRLYVACGKPVVTVGSSDGAQPSGEPHTVVRLHWMPETPDLISAVRGLAGAIRPRGRFE
jgi:CheY-like chemotaxis protein